MRKSSKRFFTVFLAVLLAFAVPFMQIGAIVSMENVKLNISAPAVGDTAPTTYSPSSIDEANTDNYELSWSPKVPDSGFEARTNYTATATMTTEDPEGFDVETGDIVDGFKVASVASNAGVATLALEKTFIDHIEIEVPKLVVGQSFPTATISTEGVQVRTNRWQVGGVPVAEDAKVEEGKSYYLYLTAIPLQGYSFTELVTTNFNTTIDSSDYFHLDIAVLFIAFPEENTISSVDVNLADLVVGQPFPEATVTDEDSHKYSVNTFWSDANDSTVDIDSDSIVEAGKSYEVKLEYYRKGDYRFYNYPIADLNYEVQLHNANKGLIATREFAPLTAPTTQTISSVDISLDDLVVGQPFPEATTTTNGVWVETDWVEYSSADAPYGSDVTGNVEADKYYGVNITYNANSGYTFQDTIVPPTGYEKLFLTDTQFQVTKRINTFPPTTQTISHVDISLAALVVGQPFPEPKSLAGTIVKTTWQEVDDLGGASEVGATVEANKLYKLFFNISANTGYVFDDNVTITNGYSLENLTADKKTISVNKQFSTNTGKTLIVGSFDSNDEPNMPTAYAPTGTIFKNQDGATVDDADDMQLNVATPAYDVSPESIFASSMPKTAKNIEYRHLSLISIFDNRSLEFDKLVDVFIPYEELGDEFKQDQKIGVLNYVGEGRVIDVNIENYQDGILLKGVSSLSAAAFYTYEDIISKVDISLADLEVGQAFPIPVINTAGVVASVLWFEFDEDGEQIEIDDNDIVEAEKRYAATIFLATEDGYEFDINLEVPAGFSIAVFKDGDIGIMKFADTVTAPTTIINSLNVTIDEPTNGEELPEAETTTPNVIIETNWTNIDGTNINNANYDENSYYSLGIAFHTKSGYELADNIAIPEGYTVALKSKFVIMLTKEYNAPSIKPYNPLTTPTKPTLLITGDEFIELQRFEFIAEKFTQMNDVPALLVNSLPSNARNIVYMNLTLSSSDPNEFISGRFQSSQRIFIPYSELGSAFNESADIGVLHLPIRSLVPISHPITKTSTGLYIENVTSLSPFAFYTLEKTSSSSNRSSDDEDESADKLEDLLDNTLGEIKDSKAGGTVVFKAGSLTNNLPVSLMSALYEHKVNLVIDWNGGKDIIIPAGKAIKTGTARAFYSFEELADMYEDAYIIENPNATSTSTKSNPSTGARA